MTIKDFFPRQTVFVQHLNELTEQRRNAEECVVTDVDDRFVIVRSVEDPNKKYTFDSEANFQTIQGEPCTVFLNRLELDHDLRRQNLEIYVKGMCRGPGLMSLLSRMTDDDLEAMRVILKKYERSE